MKLKSRRRIAIIIFLYRWELFDYILQAQFVEGINYVEGIIPHDLPFRFLKEWERRINASV